jgi:hypothetical protein
MTRALIAAVLLLTPNMALAQQGAAACMDDERYRIMDFWVGDWDVVMETGQMAGTNTIETVLDGCALIEHWTGSTGGEGKSWFYYNNQTDTWNQIWITDAATNFGGTKEKRLIGVFANGGTRFQGELRTPSGDIVLDRTTLTPLADGRVRQVIEVSRDGGTTWSTTFHAFYVKRGG